MGVLKLNYEPISFLRCHSKNRDSADVQTQVWHCAFEPSSDSNSKIVATCGGNSVCVVDCSTGSVVTKFYTKVNHLLFSLSWGMTYVNSKASNIIACGGARNTIYILDPFSHRCLLTHSLNLTSKISVNVLLFHPKKRNILFCGTHDGDIRVFSLMVNDKDEHSLKELHRFSVNSEIFDISFCEETNSILVSCNNGLYIFHTFHDIESKSKSMPNKVQLELPRNPNNQNKSLQDETKLVDSVEVLKYGYFACKCALHGNIYIFDLRNISTKQTGSSCSMKPVTVLEWSPTDNYFMYMGVSPDKSLLCCGDDKGALWLYELDDIYNNGNTNQKLKNAQVIPWPHISDSFNDKKRKLALETYDIIVDKVAISNSNKYIVAVTNNNLVCIWEHAN